MNNKIPQIKEELERRYKMCSGTTFKGFVIFVHNYLDFINKVPFLNTLLNDDENKLSIYKHFGQKIDDLSDTDIAVKWPSCHYQENFRAKLIIIHDALIGKLSEYELGLTHIIKKEISDEVRQLGLNEQSKWEDLTIVFTNEFSVLIRYKDRQCQTDHQKMGFADERIQDKTRAIKSWYLLLTLATNAGGIPLDNLNDEKKEVLKKQKQELAKLLKNYFQILGNPFEKIDKQTNLYRIKIKLVPEPDCRPDISEFRYKDILKPVS
jgi:hypothetical protein